MAFTWKEQRSPQVPRISDAVEEVSPDGETYTVTVTSTDAAGRSVDVAHRVFWRLH